MCFSFFYTSQTGHGCTAPATVPAGPTHRSRPGRHRKARAAHAQTHPHDGAQGHCRAPTRVRGEGGDVRRRGAHQAWEPSGRGLNARRSTVGAPAHEEEKTARRTDTHRRSADGRRAAGAWLQTQRRCGEERETNEGRRKGREKNGCLGSAGRGGRHQPAAAQLSGASECTASTAGAAGARRGRTEEARTVAQGSTALGAEGVAADTRREARSGVPALIPELAPGVHGRNTAGRNTAASTERDRGGLENAGTQPQSAATQPHVTERRPASHRPAQRTTLTARRTQARARALRGHLRSRKHPPSQRTTPEERECKREDRNKRRKSERGRTQHRWREGRGTGRRPAAGRLAALLQPATPLARRPPSPAARTRGDFLYTLRPARAHAPLCSHTDRQRTSAITESSAESTTGERGKE